MAPNTKAFRLAIAASALTLLFAACCTARQLKQAPDTTYLLTFSGSPTRGSVNSAIARAGCAPDFFDADAGRRRHGSVALSLTTPGFAEVGINLVSKDVAFPPADDDDKPTKGRGVDEEPAPTATPTPTSFFSGPITDTSQIDDPFWPRQWAPKAIGAPAAWAKGINGRCVRVAVVDSIFGPPHNDLKKKFDYNVSRGFGNIDWTWNSTNPVGTYVAGIIGAEAKNNDAIVGVAYGSTLIGLNTMDANGYYWASKVAQAIIFAAKRKAEGCAGADVIHAKFAATWDRANETQRTENGTSNNAMAYLNKAISSANRNGVLVVVPAGQAVWPGSGIDLTYQKSNFTGLCENANVLCVGAYGATGLCKGGCAPNNVICNSPLDVAGANYSQLHPMANYGRSVDVAGPAGVLDNYPGACHSTNAIFSTGRYNIRVYSSEPFMASPHAAALAALYIQKAAMDKGILESELCNPARTRTIIKTAIKRGAVMPPGNAAELKKYFGNGYINVPNTLGL
ncbi:hypothetical protein HYH03_013962 [Edaphochlamys debaryana]|uniref:Peptidase S8/S53 domain-containing protein n=1 Tax=Edaphochlamys debaryana TaxID=47281 RepID=A0A836BTZ4_9CHLO|nr:hypothetical protein HYH03_013962 [Edaphochlamys debaryana]|eukprot:KAG2487393.1 hypothetical protein HYH03_013962 [Edaphochlamys debaryana]